MIFNSENIQKYREKKKQQEPIQNCTRSMSKESTMSTLMNSYTMAEIAMDSNIWTYGINIKCEPYRLLRKILEYLKLMGFVSIEDNHRDGALIHLSIVLGVKRKLITSICLNVK